MELIWKISVRRATLRYMTTNVLTRDDLPVTTKESVWQRLARIVDARRKFLHMSQEDVLAEGGPSVSWQAKLRHKTETPGVRHKVHLDKLDKVLLWDPGTSMRLLVEDRSSWSDALLEDEELQLVEGRKDRVSAFAAMVEVKLRGLEPDHAEAMMRRIARVMGLPVLGD